MPIPTAVRELVYNSALGMIRRAGGDVTVTELVRRLRQRYDPDRSHGAGDYAYIARQAARNYESGRGYAENSRASQRPPAVSTDPTLSGSDFKFRYRVIVEVPEPDGTVRDVFVILNEYNPLTIEQIVETALGLVIRSTDVGRHYRSGVLQDAVPGSTVHVVGAGRRPA